MAIPGPPCWRFGARGPDPPFGVLGIRGARLEDRRLGVAHPGHGFRLKGGGVPVSVPGSKVPKVPKVSKSVKKRQKVSKNVIFGIFRISGHFAQKGSKKALFEGGPPV